MRVVDVLVPVALDQAYSYRVPEGLDLKPGDVVAVPLGPREALGVVWADNPNPKSAAAQPAEGRQRKTRRAAAQARAAQLRRLGRGLHARLARHGAAHVAAHGRASGPRPRARRRAARRSSATTDDRGTRPRARSVPRRPHARQRRCRARGGRVRRRDRRADRHGRAGDRRAAARAGGGATRSGFCQAGILARPARRRRCLAHHGGARRLHRDAARRRHRLGQDRGLFRRRGGEHPPQAADADPDAGDRAHRAIPRPFLGALRRAPGGMAFAALAARASAHLGGGGGERGDGDRRRALGAVPALRRSRPHHRRRGARPRLQAGGRRALSRPRHGGGARLDREDPGAARLRHAFGRIGSQRAARPLSPSASAGALRRRPSAGDRGDRHAARRPAARPLHLAAAGRSRAADARNAKSRRCCSSTAAAMRRSRSAAPAASACSARTATPGWSITASASGWSATIAASRCRRRSNARTATPPKASRPSAPASSGWSRRRPSCFRRRASWCCRATWWNRSSACGRSSTTWRKAASISSSARNWSPRVTISPSSIWSASSTPTWGSATAIRAPPSAPSSCCIRWSAAPAARRAAASATCRRTSPSTR